MNFLVYSIVSLFYAAIVIDCQKIPSVSWLKIACLKKLYSSYGNDIGSVPDLCRSVEKFFRI